MIENLISNCFNPPRPQGYSKEAVGSLVNHLLDASIIQLDGLKSKIDRFLKLRFTGWYFDGFQLILMIGRRTGFYMKRPVPQRRYLIGDLCFKHQFTSIFLLCRLKFCTNFPSFRLVIESKVALAVMLV